MKFVLAWDFLVCAQVSKWLILLPHIQAVSYLNVIVSVHFFFQSILVDPCSECNGSVAHCSIV